MTNNSVGKPAISTTINSDAIQVAAEKPYMKLFPYSRLRDPQIEFMDTAWQALKTNRSMIAHAPTGIGKTCAALVPALAYAKENNKKILFLTSRHAQHKIVIETLQLISSKSNEEIKVTDLIGKKWLCNRAECEHMSAHDFREYCRSLRKEHKCEYYNRTYKNEELTDAANRAIVSINKTIMHSDDAKSRCVGLCAYEIFLARAKESDIIIADYFHMFSPAMYKAFLQKIGSKIEDIILIVDEAHNLPSRARALLSVQLSLMQVSGAIKEAIEVKEEDLAKDIEFIYKKLVERAREKLTGTDEMLIDTTDVTDAVEGTTDYEFLIDELERVADIVRKEKKKSFLGGIANFLDRWKDEGPGFVRIIKKSRFRKTEEYLYTRECLDPSIATREIFESVHSAILMSGTLLPLDMYSSVLGIDNPLALKLESPFPRENKLSLVIKEVTTKYSMRTRSEYVKIANSLVRIIDSSRGNIGLFFPSYSLRDEIYGIISDDLKKDAILERQNMTKKEKLEMLAEFARLKNKGAVLFAVVGANFSEGISFDGKLMNACVLVGLPLQKPDLLTDSLIKYYNLKFKKGWEYGYVYPSMNAAVQAAGRCIRSEKDRGAIIFMDGRYLWENYRKVIPPDYELKVSHDIEQELGEFFKNKSVLSGYASR